MLILMHPEVRVNRHIEDLVAFYRRGIVFARIRPAFVPQKGIVSASIRPADRNCLRPHPSCLCPADG